MDDESYTGVIVDMKQILVISGKGGTGKTVLTSSLAVLAKGAVLADCDVDAADLHLLLHPVVKEVQDFWSGQKAAIDDEQCINCGRCLSLCRFEAVKTLKNQNGSLKKLAIDPVACEGCRVCYYTCPVDAIRMEDRLSGQLFISETKYGPMVHAKLGIAEENSGKLVALVKQKAQEIAEAEGKTWLIVDGPPGIGCPVIAALARVDLALIVAEPTLSGIHDMERVVDLAAHFGVTTKVVINKCDINWNNTQAIEEICQKRGIEVIGRLPFSEEVVRSLILGIPVVEFSQGEIAEEITALWRKIEAIFQEEGVALGDKKEERL